jgi:hypothetical protein
MHCLAAVLLYVIIFCLSGKPELLKQDYFGTVIKNIPSDSSAFLVVIQAYPALTTG